jgi:hypothetical protein
VLEPDEDRIRGQELDPGRGELDGQGHPVEARADGGDRRRILVRDGEPRPDRHRTFDEQSHRGVLAERRVDAARAAPAGGALRPVSWLGSGGVGRPGTGYSCSPDTWRVARLVTTALTWGGSQQVGDDGAAATTCSKLSSTRRTVLSRSQSASDSATGRARPRRCRPSSRSAATSIGSADRLERTKNTPSGSRRRPARAAATASSCRSRRGRSASGAWSRRGARPPRPVRHRARRTSSAASAGCWDGRRACAVPGTRTAGRRR